MDNLKAVQFKKYDISHTRHLSRGFYPSISLEQEVDGTRINVLGCVYMLCIEVRLRCWQCSIKKSVLSDIYEPVDLLSFHPISRSLALTSLC